jgi:hypothetical protein
VLAALGPRLAEAGVPAVVAMQGDISMTTAAAFTTAFFASLDEDGIVDRAMAVARAAVRDRPDWWAPTLFMRLKSGRLWYIPGGFDGGPFPKWPALIDALQRGVCTPIIGPGISDALLGTRQEIARTWAKSYGFPMAIHERDSLPQVAQYMSTHQNEPFLRAELENSLRRTLLERYHEKLPPELLRGHPPLEELIASAWEERHGRDDLDPYSVLAMLPVPVYVTTQPSRLLARALTDAGRDPVIESCRWNGDDDDWSESIFEQDPGYRPTPERPLIYHLLGTLDQPESLVLTEDDYFDFLIGVTRNQELVPSMVRRRLAATALMFVGFRLDEWDFRVLYRTLMSSEGRNKRREFTHVAVQIDPGEDAAIDARRARSYLEEYFQGSRVSVYWGTTEHFIRELHEKWQGRMP